MPYDLSFLQHALFQCYVHLRLYLAAKINCTLCGDYSKRTCFEASYGDESARTTMSQYRVQICWFRLAQPVKFLMVSYSPDTFYLLDSLSLASTRVIPSPLPGEATRWLITSPSKRYIRCSADYSAHMGSSRACFQEKFTTRIHRLRNTSQALVQIHRTWDDSRHRAER